MKPIILLFISIFFFPYVAFCQSSNDEYFILTEYYYNDEGKQILIPTDSIEYHRITNKDHSTWGFKNKERKIMIPPGKYSFLNPVDKYGMILAQKDGKEGYIDITDKVLIPFIYDNVGVFSTGVELASVIKDGKQGFINRKGEIITPLEYDGNSYNTNFHSGVAILTKNKRYGVINTQNNIIIPFEYEKIKYSDNQDCLIVTKDYDWATYSFEGKQLSEFDNYFIISRPLSAIPSNRTNLPLLITTDEMNVYLDKTQYLEEIEQNKRTGNTPVENKFAYIDKTKKVVVPFGTYDYATPFGLGRKAIVAKQGVFGIIDEYGKPILPLSFDFIEQPSEYANIFLATKGQTVTVYNQNAQIIPIKGIESYKCRDNHIIISDIHNKKGLLDYDGTQSIPFEYDTLYTSRSISVIDFIARKGDTYGYISRKNEIIKPFKYKHIYGLKDDLVFVNADGKAGMYDKEGNIKLAFEYDSICDTHYNSFEPEENKYIVIKNGKVGTVDIHNKVIIPIIYDELSGWVEYGPEAHFAKKDGKYGLISYEGQIIIPLEYEYVDLPVAGIIVVRKNGKYGALSWKNKEILPCIYDRIINDMPIESIGDTREPKLIVLSNGNWSYYDKKGDIIRKNVPKEVIMESYGHRIERGEPSNENLDFEMKRAKK